MAKGQFGRVMGHLRDLVKGPATSPLTDGQLLERFASRQDEAAFEVLLTRHAPLVLGVCRRTLHDPHDVEDAFQAVFLVLARKAGQLDRRAPLSNWLFSVARLAALKLRRQRAARPAAEAKAQSWPAPDPLAEITARELYSALDEELARLPEKYRAPLLLCYLEGQTQDEAARHLGLSLATVKRRLGQGRDCLRRRLTRRGLSLPAALLAGLMAQAGRSAAGHAPLLRATLQAAVRPGVPGPTAAPVSPQAVALAREVTSAMLLSRLTTVSALLVGLLLAVSGAGLLASAPGPDQAATPAAQPEPAAAEAGPTARTDRHGDPLPAGAVARLGTVRFRHGMSVDRLTFSPDSKRIASWDCFRGIVLWDVATGRAVRELPVGIDAGVVAFSPDGKTLAVPHCSPKESGKIVIGLFEVATGREIRQLRGGQFNFPALAFSHEGKLLAAAGYDNSLRLWEAATGRQLRECQKGQVGGPFEFHQDLAFSPDDRVLAWARGAGPITLWDVSTGKNLRQLKGHEGAVLSVSFSPDGRTLVAAGQDACRRWDVGTGKALGALGEKCTHAGLTRDGKVLASIHAGGLVRLWDVPGGKAVRRWRAPSDQIRTVTFSPDGRLLATGGGWDSVVHLWDVATGKEMQPPGTHQGIIQALAFGPDGTTLLAGSSDRRLCRWDLATQTPRQSCRCDVSRPVFAIAFSPDRKTFATAEQGANSVIRVQDLATGKVLQSLAGLGPDGANLLAFAPDGRTLASTGLDRVVRLWDLATGKEVRQFHGPKVWVTSLAISPDGRVLAAADSRETERSHRVYLWDLAGGQELGQLERESVIESLASSPDSRMLAVAGRGPWIDLWEVQSGKRVHQMKWSEPEREWFMTAPSTHRLAFSNDGRLLASGGAGKRREDCAIRLWNVVTGKEVCRWEGHPSAVTQLAFSPDDRRLASGGADSAIVLWDVAAWRGKTRLANRRLSPEALKARWDDLVSPDAAKAYRAVWALAASPEESVPFVRSRLARVATPRGIERLIADLDSDRFATRQQAERELARLGYDAEASLRRALENRRLSLEMRSRLEQLLRRLELSPEWMRYLRALQVLEYSATPEARQVLQGLAEGAPGSRLTREAKAALARLAKRPGGA
jgi:RNA polymerase sigma factor (sigma-70 family)